MIQEPIKKAVWRNENYMKLWLGTVLSALGDSAMYILLSWFVIDQTGSEGVLGTTLMCMSIPRLVFMLVGGVTADRINRKLIMFLSILSRAILLGLFSGLLWTGETVNLQSAVYMVAVLFGIVDAFFWPARSSIMPFIVPKEQLPAANSILETSQQLSMVGGPLLASLLLVTNNYPLMFCSIAVAFFVSLFFIAFLQLKPLKQEQAMTDVTSAAATSAFGEMLAGVRYVLSLRVLTIIMVVSLFINMMLMGPLQIGMPVLLKQLHWDGSAFGYLESMVGIGAILGGILTGVMNGFRGSLNLVVLFLALLGVAIALLHFMNTLSFGLAMMLIAGMMISSTNIPLITYIQTVVPSQMLGRVMSLLSLMSMGFGPVSYALTSFLLENNIAGPRSLMLYGGSAMAVLGLCLILFRDVRRMEDHPEWQNAAPAKKSTKQPGSQAVV